MIPAPIVELAKLKPDDNNPPYGTTLAKARCTGFDNWRRRDTTYARYASICAINRWGKSYKFDI